MDPALKNSEPSKADLCESAMNRIVDMRKSYGKACIEYGDKITTKQLELLKADIDQMQNIQIKHKVLIPTADLVAFEAECDQFLEEEQQYLNRVTRMKNKMKNLKEIANQIKKDKITPLLNQSISSEKFLAKAKADRENDNN